jgi:hypothetical protein
MKHQAAPFLLALLATASFAAAPPPSSSPAATEPVKGIDTALETDISVAWDHAPLHQVLDDLRRQTQTNLVVNWPALTAAGITADTPITLHLTIVSYEAVVRSLLRVAAPQSAGLNYLVGGNTLELSTNTAFGNASQEHLYPVAPLLLKKMAGPITQPIITQRATDLQNFLLAALRIANEPVTAQTLSLKDGLLIVTASPRGHALMQRLLTQLGLPTPIGSLVPGTAESLRAKKTAEALKPLADPATGELPLLSLATNNAAPVNVLLLPAARSTPHPPLDALIDDAGILEIGTPDELAQRSLPGIYDVSELLRRRSLRNHTTPDEELTKVVADLRSQIHPEAWGDLPTAFSSITPYAHELLILAPAATHREITAALQAMYKGQ